MKRKIKIYLIAGLILLLLSVQANAELITIEIEAVVDSVKDDGPGDGWLDGQISVGDIITGYYTYESTTADTNPSDYVGHYRYNVSPYGILLNISNFDFQTDMSNVDFLVQIINAGETYLEDSYTIGSGNNLALSNGTQVDIISWSLTDSSANALSSDALPQTPPVLNNWESNLLRLYGERDGYIIDAHVTSAVPEPTTLLLFGLGGLLFRKIR
jgi:hypothetical protein